MNRRGLVMAKKRFTKNALWNDQTTDHPQQKRTSFPFKRSGRTDVWPLPAERLQQAAFKPLREKSPYPRSTRQAFKPLFHDASENCRRRRLREEADFAGGQKSFKTSSWWIASWGCGIFQKILLFSSCFEAVNSNPPPPGGACVAKLTPGQHKNQISAMLKGVFIC